MNHKRLDVWNESMELVKLIYGLTQKLPKEESYGISSQIKRAAVSIPSNIAEGSARKSDKEFIYFLNISRGSLAELETQLIIVSEVYNVNDSKIAEKIVVVGKLINGLISYLKNKKNDGTVGENLEEYNVKDIVHQSPITILITKLRLLMKVVKLGKEQKSGTFLIL